MRNGAQRRGAQVHSKGNGHAYKEKDDPEMKEIGKQILQNLG